MVEIKHKIIGLLIALGISIAIPMTIHADNQDVMDNANVLNNQTEQYIKQVNDKDLSKVKGHPQIAVITEKQVDGDIEAKAQQLFNKYQFGRKGYDNGVLLLLDIQDHKVRMQTGYGIESAVPDDFVNQLMNDRVQNDFRKKDYSTGTRVMVGKLSKRIITHKSELRSKSDVNNHQAIIDQQNAKRKQIEHIIGYTIFILIFTGYFIFLIYLISKAVSKGIKDYRDTRLVTKTAREVITVINAKLLDQHLSPYQLTLDELPEADIKDIKNKAQKDIKFNTRQELFNRFNLIVINKMLVQIDSKYGFIVDDQKVKTVYTAIMLSRCANLGKPLDNYQYFVDRYIKFEQDQDKLFSLARNVSESDTDSFNNKLVARVKESRNEFSNLTDEQFDSVVQLYKLNRDTFSTSLTSMIVSLLGDNTVQSYLMGDNFDINGTFDSANKQLVDNWASKVLTKINNQDNLAYEDEIDTKFDELCSTYDIGLYISSDELAELDNLTTDEKLRAIKQKDKLSFVSVVSSILISYATAHMYDTNSYMGYDSYDSYDSDWKDDNDDDYHSHHHDHWNDGSGWGSGSGGLFDGSDDGGSFGGFGGFSGGGGGTAGW